MESEVLCKECGYQHESWLTCYSASKQRFEQLHNHDYYKEPEDFIICSGLKCTPTE